MPLYGDELYGDEMFSEDSESAVSTGLGSYNEQLYNESTYNAAVLVMLLTDAVSSADQESFVDSLTHAELVTIMDVLQRFFGGQILADTLTLPDDLAKQALLTRTDTINSFDVRTMTAIKILIESMSMADVRTYVYSTSKVDAVNLADFLFKQITNKRVNELITMNDWFTIKHNPQSDPWS